MGDDATQPAPWQRKFWYAALTALAMVALVGVIAGVVYLVVEVAAFLQPLLIPVVVAVILTYLLGPVVDKISSFGIGRMWSVLLLFLLIGLGFTGIGLWVGPILWHQTSQFGATLPEQASRGQELMLATMEWVRGLQQKVQPVPVLGEDRTIRDELWSWVAGYIEDLIAWLQERLPAILGAVGGFLQRSVGGFLGVAQEFADRGVERGDWGLFTRFVASVAINGAADMVGATHVFAVKLMFAEMSDPEGRYTTNGRAPLLKFVGWDVERGVGLRWFARVASTGNPEKPFHVIPWDKPDTTERYDWMDRLEIRPDLHLDHSELGDYVMKIMTPGVEALDCLDDDESVNPCEGYVQYLGNMLDRNHDASDIELAMTELGLSEDAADALVEQAERVFSGMYARRVTKKGMEA